MILECITLGVLTASTCNARGICSILLSHVCRPTQLIIQSASNPAAPSIRAFSRSRGRYPAGRPDHRIIKSKREKSDDDAAYSRPLACFPFRVQSFFFFGCASLQWATRLDDVWKGKPTDSLDLALVDVRENYPSLPIAPFKVTRRVPSYLAGFLIGWKVKVSLDCVRGQEIRFSFLGQVSM